MEDKGAQSHRILGIIESIFWVLFILVPIFTGLLAYHWLPNESPMLADGQVLKPYEIISSHEECNDSDVGSQCGTIVDVWRNTATGVIYSKADFKEHRISERNRMTIWGFLYGLIGCVFFAGLQHYKKKDFYKYFGVAMTANLAFAAYTFISSRVTF